MQGLAYERAMAALFPDAEINRDYALFEGADGIEAPLWDEERFGPFNSPALLAKVAELETEAARATLVAYAADLRWKLEQAGAVWNGWPIHTDDRSQGKYLSELQAISLGVRLDNDPWKFADSEFRPVSNADFPQLATAAREHVRTVFGIEAGVLAAIDGGTITTRAEIDAAFA